jgi:hypothetical protein
VHAFKFDFSLFRLWSDRGGAPLAVSTGQCGFTRHFRNGSAVAEK